MKIAPTPPPQLPADFERLILSRNVGDAIAIDGPCFIRVLRASNNRLRIAIEARKTTRIARVEIASTDFLLSILTPE